MPDSFSLRRTACYGTSPVYTIDVTPDDYVTYMGFSFVAAEGPRVRQLPRGSFGRIVLLLNEARFGHFDSAYPDRDYSNCESFWADMPSVTMILETAECSHQVYFNLGCLGFEGRERLQRLVAEVDRLLDIGDWVNGFALNGAEDGPPESISEVPSSALSQ